MSRPLRSATSTQGRNMAGARALWRATGMGDDDFGKPIIAIANSYTQFVPGHVHLKNMGDLVAGAIEAAGGVAKEFNTIAVDDGIAMGHDGMLYSLPSRDLIADCVETMVNAHRADALVCISNCDKITPGMLLAAMRLNIPTIFVSGGPMESGAAVDGVGCRPPLEPRVQAAGDQDSDDDGDRGHEDPAQVERLRDPVQELPARGGATAVGAHTPVRDDGHERGDHLPGVDDGGHRVDAVPGAGGDPVGHDRTGLGAHRPINSALPRLARASRRRAASAAGTPSRVASVVAEAVESLIWAIPKKRAIGRCAISTYWMRA